MTLREARERLPGVYALFRVVPHIGPPQAVQLGRSLLVLAAVTMLVGVLGALGRGGIREILSFHVVSQIGYMIFGLALRSRAGLAAGFLFILQPPLPARHRQHHPAAPRLRLRPGGIQPARRPRRPAPAPTIRAGDLTVDVSGLSPFQRVLVANLILLTPGTIVAGLDESGDRLVLHTLYAWDAEAVLKDARRFVSLVRATAGDLGEEESP